MELLWWARKNCRRCRATNRSDSCLSGKRRLVKKDIGMRQIPERPLGNCRGQCSGGSVSIMRRRSLRRFFSLPMDSSFFLPYVCAGARVVSQCLSLARDSGAIARTMIPEPPVETITHLSLFAEFVFLSVLVRRLASKRFHGTIFEVSSWLRQLLTRESFRLLFCGFWGRERHFMFLYQNFSYGLNIYIY